MYGKGSWGGSVDPFILVKIEKPDNLANPDAIASLVIFEWHDETLIGMAQDGSKNVQLKSTYRVRKTLSLTKARNSCSAFQTISRQAFATRPRLDSSLSIRTRAPCPKPLSSHAPSISMTQSRSIILSPRPVTIVFQLIISQTTHITEQ